MDKKISTSFALSVIVIIAGFFIAVYWLGEKSAARLEKYAASGTEKEFSMKDDENGGEVADELYGINKADGEPLQPEETEGPGCGTDKHCRMDNLAYIKSVYEKGRRLFIDVDHIRWLSGDEAVEAKREDGQCPKGEEECFVENDYYISNSDKTVRTLELSREAGFFMQTYGHTSSGNFDWNQAISLETFQKIFAKNSRSPHKDLPYHIIEKDGVVTEIAEQYIP